MLPIFLGQSAVIRGLLHSALRVARRGDDPVLITGPVGAGKSHLARFIHAHSVRAGGPLVFVACGAVAEMESELFGHRRGSFTGAMQDARGRLKQADRGVIVLDDVERLSLRHQDQLHRVLVDGTFCPVGGEAPVRVDVRFIATTNLDPQEAVGRGLLKRDFLSRLDYFQLRVPGLAEHAEDIPALAEALLERKLLKLVEQGVPVPGRLHFDPSCWPGLCRCRFDDNVRGLDKLIAELITRVEEGDLIMASDMTALLPAGNENTSDRAARTLRAVRENAEREYIEQVWNVTGFNITRTARELGVTRRVLYGRLRRYSLKRPAPE